MLGKHVALYLPAVLVPAAIALATVTIYSRILPTAEYGYCAFVTTITMIAMAFSSRWLTVAITRLYPAAQRAGVGEDFVVATFVACAGALGVVLLSIVVVGLWREAGDLVIGGQPKLVIYGFAIFAARTVVITTNSIRRAHLQVSRYALVECAQASVGFATSLLFIWLLGASASCVLAGTAFGYSAVAGFEVLSFLPILRRGRLHPATIRELARFSGPLTIIYGLSLLLSSADQLFVQALLGASAGGLYSAVSSIAGRSVTLIFSGISMAVFPLSVHALENEGVDACRRREQQNIALILTVALPAAIGLVIIAPCAVRLLLGPEYRQAGIVLLPWIVAATFINRMSVDVFDHAFYLTRRTGLLFANSGPSFLVSMGCNVLLIPHFGLLGAALAALAQAVVMLVLSVAIGSRLFAIRLPLETIFRIALASLAMGLALYQLPMSADVVGFAELVIAGIAAYGLSALALDVMGLRTRVLRVLA